MRLPFTISNKCDATGARAGELITRHAALQTPVFMPVATNAAMRGVTLDILQQQSSGIILSNTYHLLLRPGREVFEKFGDIHSFMNWPNAVLTDSGGYQIFSLARLLKISEEGAQFRSYVDGKYVLLSPEVSIGMQRAIGSDIMMAFDHCIASKSSYQLAQEALERTTRWTKRSLLARQDSWQALFGIVQGACFPELRLVSAQQITELELDGFAIGGLAVGESMAERQDITEYTASLLPSDRPRYLMGVGTPLDLLEAVKRGIDMFDCILPSALAQQGVCFTSHGKIDLKRGVYKFADCALDIKCDCACCKSFSRGYLHHLVKAGEFSVGQYLSIHNLHFYKNLMQQIRAAIVSNNFLQFYQGQREVLNCQDLDNPSKPPFRRPAKLPVQLGNYELLQQPNFATRVRHIPSGEVMHSVNDPLEEAMQLYIDQSRLIERTQNETERIVIWDVGLGAATNAMSAIMAYESLAELARAPLHIISFENDLDALKLALNYPGLFPQLRHAAPHDLLDRGNWKSKHQSLSWDLIPGDFLQTFSSADKPSLIFFDPFSYKTDCKLWHHSCFKKIADHCQSYATELYTYSASTAVRIALLCAGFYVARGVASGPKNETTFALNKPAMLKSQHAELHLLGADFLQRWQRSDAKFPADLPISEREQFSSSILQHEQFAKTFSKLN